MGVPSRSKLSTWGRGPSSYIACFIVFSIRGRSTFWLSFLLVPLLVSLLNSIYILSLLFATGGADQHQLINSRRGTLQDFPYSRIALPVQQQNLDFKRGVLSRLPGRAKLSLTSQLFSSSKETGERVTDRLAVLAWCRSCLLDWPISQELFYWPAHPARKNKQENKNSKRRLTRKPQKIQTGGWLWWMNTMLS